jgi:hypothetical protein
VRQKRSQQDPDNDDNCTRNPADSLSILDLCLRLLSAFSQYGGMEPPYCQVKAQGYEDEIIEISYDGDEVWNDVNGAERIGDDPGTRSFEYQGVRGSRAAR